MHWQIKSSYVIVMVCMTIAIASAFSPVTHEPPTPPSGALVMPTDFKLIFRYGVGAKNELNTFNGTYTRDMIMDPPITVNLSLSAEELQVIYQKMIEIDFFSYPETCPPPLGLFVLPCAEYHMKVEYDSKTKEVSWNDASLLRRTDIGDGLKQLFNCIIRTLESKEEYRELPTPRGGYI